MPGGLPGFRGPNWHPRDPCYPINGHFLGGPGGRGGVKVGQCANIIEFGEDVMIVAEMRNVSTTDPRGNAKTVMDLPFARIRRVNTPVKYVRTNK